MHETRMSAQERLFRFARFTACGCVASRSVQCAALLPSPNPSLQGRGSSPLSARYLFFPARLLPPTILPYFPPPLLPYSHTINSHTARSRKRAPLSLFARKKEKAIRRR
jgi:hypothetical protein